MYDYHTHSLFSSDAKSPLEAIVEKGVELGLKEIAITDHYDPDFRNPVYNYSLDFDVYQHALQDAERRYKSSINVVKGLELGLQHGSTIKKCSKAAAGFPYDFILGAFHCAEGFDVYESAYYKGRSIEETYRAYYTYILQTLSVYKDYDVVAHINYIDRNSPCIPAFNTYADIVAKIMSLLVSDGKGIEINTASIRHGMDGLCTPTMDILEMYVKSGGEIVTIGSDAHCAEHVGYAYDQAAEMLMQTGLRHIATFKDRKPRLVRL